MGYSWNRCLPRISLSTYQGYPNLFLENKTSLRTCPNHIWQSLIRINTNYELQFSLYNKFFLLYIQSLNDSLQVDLFYKSPRR